MERIKVDNLGIPPLAGICSYEEACKTGYDVEYNVQLLQRYNNVKSQLVNIYSAHIACTPEWEVKCAISLHMWLEAEHCAMIRKRVSEMREPPLSLDKVHDDRLQLLMNEVIRSRSTIEFIAGIYNVIKPEMITALKKHLHETNPLADHPTTRILKIILSEEEEMIVWGEQALKGLIHTQNDLDTVSEWIEHLNAFLVNAGGITGGPSPESHSLPMQRSDNSDYEIDVYPKRDGRFYDVYNSSAKIDEYYIDSNRDHDERVYALLYKRLREMDVPEWMGPIIYKTKGKKWDYYVDMSRQLWDECRHAMMGEVGLYQDGIPFYSYPICIHSSVVLNTAYEPWEAHLGLWATEQGLMPKETGKYFELTIAKSAKNSFVAMLQDYDWADEVLHAQIGRKWLIPMFSGVEEALKKNTEIRNSKAPAWNDVTQLSDQKEWWPDFITKIRQTRDINKKNH